MVNSKTSREDETVFLLRARDFPGLAKEIETSEGRANWLKCVSQTFLQGTCFEGPFVTC